MDGPVGQARHFASHMLAKETSHLVSPPPAYTPCPQPAAVDARTIAARQIYQQQHHHGHHQQHHHGHQPPLQRPQLPQRPAPQPRPVLIRPMPVAELLTGSAIDDTSDMADDMSPISLRINTSVRVASNNNVVVVQATPSDSAKQIADAVIKAMRDYSAGNCGLPMIDEEGRPRPIGVDVDAAMVVQGSNNFVGTEETFGQYLEARTVAQGQAQRRRRDEPDDDAADEAGPAKRARSTE